MLDLRSPSTQLLFATARIEVARADGSVGTGTAFIFDFLLDQQRTLPCLVTNKHVVKSATHGAFQLHEADTGKPKNESIALEFDDFESRWIGHPGDADVCAMPLQPLREQAQKALGKTLFTISLNEALIPSDTVLKALSAVEDVVMVGYPIGLWDSTNNLPLLRRGVTATHPAMDFNGKREGMIDLACFPGSSGSPVLVLNEGTYRDGENITLGSRVLLLGLLYAGPQYQANGTIQIINIPTQAVPLAQTLIPAHLGFYIKSSELLVLKERLLEALKVK